MSLPPPQGGGNCFAKFLERFACPDNIRLTFLPNATDFRNSTAFWKAPRLRPSVRLVRATCRWWWMWSTAGMMLTRNTDVLADKPSQSHPVSRQSYMCWPGTVGRDSLVGITTRYGLYGPGIESRYRRDFPHPSRPAPGPNQPPVQCVLGLPRE